MYAGRTARAVVEQWQTVIQADVESGTHSVLHAGGGHYAGVNAAALDALQRLAQQRDDPAMPVVVSGGSGAQWPAALFSPNPVRAAHAQPAILFRGDDPATGMACMAACVDGLAISPYIRHPQVYHLFDPLFMPNRHPGVTATWEMLPFLVAGAQPADGIAGEARPAVNGATESQLLPENSDDWLAWSVLIPALLLPLLAIIL